MLEERRTLYGKSMMDREDFSFLTKKFQGRPLGILKINTKEHKTTTFRIFYGALIRFPNVR